MNKDVAVVIPYYHRELTETEKISFRNCLDVLGHYPIVLIVPESMGEEGYPPEPDLLFEAVPDAWMESVESYNRMMLSKDFYSRFLQYEYILVHQLDAFVFSDSLGRFCGYGYDFIGAPWLPGMYYPHNLKQCMWYVGNGGFSLRRVSAFLNILDTCPTDGITMNEDIFWASRDSGQFRVAPVEIALHFAFERYVRQCYSLNHNQLPFGCHAWEKYDFDFWRPIFAEKGYRPSLPMPEGIDKGAEYPSPFSHYLNAECALVKSCFNRLMGQRKTVYVFGAGRRGMECVWLLRHADVEDVRCIDNNRAVWGNRLWDVPVEAPDILKNVGKKEILVLIAVKYSGDEILDQLRKWGLEYGREVFSYKDLTGEITARL